VKKTPKQLVNNIADTSFHFASKNVTDEIDRPQTKLVQQSDQMSPILEQVKTTPIMEKSNSSTNSHEMESVPEIQIVGVNSSEICPVLQKDLNLVRHVLVQQPDDENVPFIQY